jgi:hypothetical protein
MSTTVRRIALAATGFALTAALAPAAWAGCGENLIKAPASWQPTQDARANPLLIQVQMPATPSIVGLWNVTFHSGGHIIDFGYAQWHSDGTEIMNSGGRSPVTQNFCLGVWASTGALNYHLNHWALSYDTSGVLNAKVNIKEDVVLAAGGNHYSGPFTIDVYDPKTGGLLQHVAGTVDAGRLLPK